MNFRSDAQRRAVFASMPRIGSGASDRNCFGKKRPGMNVYDEREADEAEFDAMVHSAMREPIARPSNLTFVQYLIDKGMTRDEAITELGKDRIYDKGGKLHIRPHTLAEMEE